MPTHARALLAALVGLTVTLPGLPLHAQSQSDLRRENQALQTRVNDLQNELDAANRRIAELQTEIQRLQEALQAARAGRTGPPPELPEEKVTVDESKPDASPRALFRALVDSHDKAMKDLEMGRPRDRARRAYLNELREWMLRVNREFKTPIKWHVREDEDAREQGPRGMVLTLRAVDPQTDVKLGEHFRVVVSRGIERRLEQAYERGDSLDVLVLRGILIPEVLINTERERPGIINNPPLIGPFAEFGFRVEPRTLLPEADDEQQNAQEQKQPE